MEQCSREMCYWPDVSCYLGHLDHTRCPSWKVGDASEQDVEQSSDAMAIPWSGNVLGLADLGFIAGRGKPFVLAIVGPENAGKTTLLAAWYLLLRQGLYLGKELRFSGSYSLAGWEAIASFLRWSPGPVQPTFPPHTTSGGGRMPGLLHLAFTRDNGRRRDYVMTDAPGEWFRKWAINREAVDAEGARWVAEHADAFLLVADREALSGAGRGTARGTIQVLARRLGAERRGRSVALVWTKRDVAVAREMENAVRNSVLEQMPDVIEFDVSIMPEPEESGDAGQGLLDLLRWSLNVQRKPAVLPDRAGEDLDPFFLFGKMQQ